MGRSRYADRVRAGAELARAVLDVLAEGNHPACDHVLVVALPRGGVPVAEPVAVSLGADLDVLPVRKVGVPGRSELAMGAVAEGGIEVVDHRIRQAAQVSDNAWQTAVTAANAELAERVRRWRPAGRPPIPPANRPVDVVDDGLATGSTALAACLALTAMGARSVMVAAPVGSAEALSLLRGSGFAVVCPAVPPVFRAVGLHYDDFGQTSDAEVLEILARFPTRAADPG